MINMKSNEKQTATMLTEEPEQPEYPYGLRISLEDESLKKLDITELPEVGQAMILQAKVEVVAVTQYERKNDESRTIELQITDMALNTDSEAKQMYPNSDMS